MQQPDSQSKRDFQTLYDSDQEAGVGLWIGLAVVRLRDALARAAVRAGVTPNRLTFAGFVFTLIGAGFLVVSASHALPVDPFAPRDLGRSWGPLIAALWLLLSAACDMLDGAVARCGGLHSDFGAVLDSSLDRFSDMAIWGACAVHFALKGNVTYNLLAIAALSNAFMISYIKARAEDLIPDCTVGYWQRGERFSAILIGAATGHMQFALWQQATLPLWTALRRLWYASAVLKAKADRRPEPLRGARSGWRGWLTPWRHPRGSVGYDLVTGFHIACIVFAPLVLRWFYTDADPIKALLQRLVAW